MAKKGYHFIIGLPRAGTTLLSKELNKYDEVLVLPESKHVIKMIRNEKNKFHVLSEYYTRFASKLEGKPYSISEKINDVIETADLKSIQENAFSIGCCFSFLDMIKQPQIIIDKNPSYTFHWENLIRQFPTSKFVILVRNPKGFVYSKTSKKHPNEKIHSPYSLAYIWNNFITEILAFVKSQPNKTMLVKYEDLVSTRKTTDDICRFLGIKGEDTRAKQLEKKLENFVEEHQLTERLRTKYTDLSQPINTNRINAYKKLNLKTLKRVEFICNQNMNKLGYKIEHGKSSNFTINIPYWLLGKIHQRRAKK